MRLSILKPLCALIASLLMCLAFAYVVPAKASSPLLEPLHGLNQNLCPVNVNANDKRVESDQLLGDLLNIQK